MNNILLPKFIEAFVEDKHIRCCGSCIGGCLEPSVCFICCGYSIKDLQDWCLEHKDICDKIESDVRTEFLI